MKRIDPKSARDFAKQTVEQLREAGHQALWAGGCVRDDLLGLVPKDYDVATSATPDEVRDLFGRRRTIPVAAFGVVALIGPKAAGQVEIATFREDGGYSDGRHPDSVKFSSAEHDAQRRDFTINGLFFDPVAEEVIDYVGGQADLKQGIVRAIGDPRRRIQEDKLRMLRAIRFAARFGFELDLDTETTITELASLISQVSQERITNEVERMLTHENRLWALEALARTELIEHLPIEPFRYEQGLPSFERLKRMVATRRRPTFATMVALWLWPFQPSGKQVSKFCRAWKLTNEDRKLVEWSIAHELELRTADQLSWPQLQRMLIRPEYRVGIEVAEAIALTGEGDLTDEDALTGIELCREKAALPTDQLNPDPLITGDDLQSLGLTPGPQFKRILEGVRDEQLEGRLSDRASAIEWIQDEVGRTKD